MAILIIGTSYTTKEILSTSMYIYTAHLNLLGTICHYNVNYIW